MTATGLPLFDAAESKHRKDTGMSLALSNAGSEFTRRALAAIGMLPPGQYLGEDVRARLIEQGIAPEKPQAWGAVINVAIKRRLLIGTGRFEQTRSIATHRHRTQVLEKLTA